MLENLRVWPHVECGGALHLGFVVEDVGVDPEERHLLAPGVHGEAEFGIARQPRYAQFELERLQTRGKWPFRLAAVGKMDKYAMPLQWPTKHHLLFLLLELLYQPNTS